MPEDSTRRPTISDTSPLRVLLVDDDEDDYALTRDLLGAIDGTRFDLHWAPTCEAALSAFAADDSELLLLDYNLGSHTGVELLQRARALGYRAPALFLTGQSDRAADLQAMHAGATDFLVKSTLTAQLLERSIRYALERHRLLSQLESYAGELSEREQQLRRIMDQCMTGIVVTGATNEVLFANRTAEGYFSSSPGALHGQAFPCPAGARELAIALPGGDEGVGEIRAGAIQWHGRAATLVTLVDISERKRAEALLARQARTDSLTGLANRTLFHDFLDRALSRARRAGTCVALMFLDLDHFKQVNDRLGHQVGDDLIRRVAERVAACLRGEDLVARLGGDEFAVVIDAIPAATVAGQVAEKILAALEEPFSIAGNEIVARSSIGLATFPADGCEAGDLIKASDTAMYEAKRLGRNNYQYFAREMQEAAVMRSILEYDLDYGLRHGQFVLYFQPKVHARSGRVVGVEALLRWNHDRRGLLAPGDFIQVAEDCGLIVPLGRWVLRAACEQMRAWREQGLGGAFSMAVNVSMRQFDRDDLVASVLEAIETSGVDPTDLELELTETAIMRDPQTSIADLRRLHEAGVGIAIDDFGTGYSSLQYLRLLPIDSLKIDRSFVADIGRDPDDEIIVRTTINLAHNLGLEVVAEGVETQFQHDYLVNNGCDLVQGFLFGEPMPASTLAARLGRTGPRPARRARASSARA